MAWIKTVAFGDATGRLRKLYDRVTGPGANVDNIMMAHSLRPHTMEGHMSLYKNVLHHNGNELPKWVLEMIGVWVSSLNGCDYCVEHHFSGLKRLMCDDARSDEILAAIKARDLQALPVRACEREAMNYARKLTQNASEMVAADLQPLREAGLDDGKILEINQVVAYFAYANRTVLGLGCSTEGDVLGLSPGNGDDPSDWGHQ